jgi:acyl dehydratase
VTNANEVDRHFIGTTTQPWTVEVEKGAIRAFAIAIGDEQPLYVDEAFAKAKGYRSVVAPPTFAVTFRPPQAPPWMAPLDEGRFLAGEQWFKSVRPIVAGDVFTCRLHLVDVVDKAGRNGRLQFMQAEMRAHDASGRLVVTNGRVTAYRASGALKATT